MENISYIIVLHQLSPYAHQQPIHPDVHTPWPLHLSLRPAFLPSCPTWRQTASQLPDLFPLQLPANIPCRVITFILMTFSIMSTWLQLSPSNLDHFHPLHYCIPLAVINLLFLLNTLSSRVPFSQNNSDNLFKASCSRTMRSVKRKEPEGQPKAQMCLSYQS